ncbi:LysR family transcriptional regulator, partial [Klebsiella pneumoniae]|nr:LysR family transcriptional regulator [Klebsiella pneumoniae]
MHAPRHSYLKTIILYINKVVSHPRHITTMLGMVEAGIGIAAVPAMSMPAGEHSVLR